MQALEFHRPRQMVSLKNELSPLTGLQLQFEDFVVDDSGRLVVPVSAQTGVGAGRVAVGSADVAGEL